MSGVICFGPERDQVWGVAGWAFNGFLDHVLEELSDADLRYVVQQAMALNGLHFHLEPETKARLIPIVVRVAEEVTDGKRLVSVEGRVLDERSQEQFRGAVAKLRDLALRHAAR
jgi:hypothetical protein